MDWLRWVPIGLVLLPALAAILIVANPRVERKFRGLYFRARRRMAGLPWDAELDTTGQVVDKLYQVSASADEQGPVDKILARAHAAEAQDPYRKNHSWKVSKLGHQIAIQAGLPLKSVWEVLAAGLFHDVGMIHVPQYLLLKHAPLTAEEFGIIKSHAAWGGKILEPLKEAGIACIVRHHHERYDGTGYPDRVVGETIPLGARIVAVAEAFHDMVSDHPYKRARPFDEAVAEISRCSGTQFDPRIVTAFLDWVQTHGAPGKHKKP